MYGMTPEAAESRQITTLDAIRSNVLGCREDIDGGDKCWQPAEYILWGKLFPREALGPRCYDCAAKHVGHRALGDPSYAIVNLAALAVEIDEAHQRAAGWQR